MKKKPVGKPALQTSVPAAYLVMHGQVKEVTRDTIRNLNYPKLPPPLPTSFQMAARKFFPEVEEDAPDWAKRAAQMAFASAMPPQRKRIASGKYLEGFDCGKFSAAYELLPADMRPPSPSEFGGLDDRQLAALLPADQAADFFCGLRDGEKFVREMPDRARAAQRVKEFRAVAVHWREVAKFKSSSELWQWLLTKTEEDGKQTVASSTDSREVRKVCKLIGLRYR